MEEQIKSLEKINKLPKWLTTVTPFSKYLAMLLFIILPIAGFYLGMQYQDKITLNKSTTSSIKITSASQHENWKTYRNNSLGYAFNYPSELRFFYRNYDEELGDHFMLQNYADGLSFENMDSKDFKISVNVYKKSTIYSLEYFSKNTTLLGQSFDIDGKLALRGAVPVNGEDEPYVMFEHDDYFYRISLNDPKSSNAAWFEQILKTFNFTDSPSSYVWKDYANSNYGFSFQYPSYMSRLVDNLQKKPTGISSDNLAISSLDYKYRLSLHINSRFGMECNPTLEYEVKQSSSSAKVTKINADKSGPICGFYLAKIDLGDDKWIYMAFSFDDKNLKAQSDFEKLLSTFKHTN